MCSKKNPIWLGICAGVLVSLVFGLVYFIVLREPGSAFYLFAGFTFLGGSLIGGMVAAMGDSSASDFPPNSVTALSAACKM